jgi:uncharacterized protein (TIGR03435 family)
MKRIFAKLTLVTLLPGVSLGQTAATPPVFEVADVHVSAPGSTPTGGFAAGGRFELRGATMLDLITTAYGVEPEVVIGGPGWLNTDRFDIIAKAASASASQETLQAMLQALLADRFKLEVRHDLKEMPVYALVVGRKGVKLQPAANPGKPESSRVDGAPGLNNHRACRSFTMTDLAGLLPQIARNFVVYPVVDMTGLTGSYDFQLDWMGMGLYAAAKANPDGPPAVSMFDALEKIGLKLEEQKKPMPVIAVDHVNRTPADNPPGVTKQIPAVLTEFEVAEVRPSKPGAVAAGQEGRTEFRNGRLEMLNVTLKALISAACDAEDDAIAGGPSWLDTDRFDLIAKAPATAPEDVVPGMLKTLIIQRFKLTTHKEDRPLPVFALELGKRSPKLKEADGSARSECKIVVGEKGRTYACQNTTMAQLAERLPEVAQAYIVHPMVDLTGLKGAYDFDLTWTPRGRLPKLGAKAGDGQGTPEASMPEGDVTVFEAVDKQLGLQLRERKYPRPVIVVDHVDRTPREN